MNSWWQKLATFVLTVIGGGSGKISIDTGVTLPKFSLTDTINVFGRNDVVSLSASGSDGKLTLEVKAQNAGS